ncbi:MAG: sigma-70 family RNA polymerase sigma factor [Provencibacterium sp.]|jgi:RNA polymerase sporulation-specific sigma factor|nr:sigma-70 family RNA polymerase sigma factor [Provencibacterium sp.]
MDTIGFPSSYHTQTDPELIQLIRKGDELAFGCLCARYLSLCRLVARRYSGLGLEEEDLAQEGMVGLIEATRRFDPCKQVPFEAYARKCISSKILSALDALSAQKRKANLDSLPLDEQQDAPGLHIPSPDELFIESEEVQKRSEQILSLLSPSESDTLRLYLRGCSYAQIAAQLGLPQKSVDNALQRVRRKLRSAFGR